MVDLVAKLLTPEFMVIVLAGVAAFATVLTLMMPMFSGDKTDARMKAMAIERDKMRAERLSQLGTESGLRQKPKTFMQQILTQLKLSDALDSDKLREKLKMAGMRGQAPVVAFMFFRLVTPIVVLLATAFYFFVLHKGQEPSTIIRLLACVLAAYVGFYLPNLWVSNLIQKRQLLIKRAFPDALDLLLICVQSGMSIEAAFGKVSKEITTQCLELGEELTLTTAELSYLQNRRQAYENLGARTGLPGVKAVGTALIQAERYGTPLAQALRVMAQENRDIRMSEAEKKAASLPPKLTVPMILCFLPVLFIVILGPAGIQLMSK